MKQPRPTSAQHDLYFQAAVRYSGCYPTMNVYDVMTPHPIIIFSNNVLEDALERMRQTGCHHLPVISSDKHLVGVLSFHDCQRVLGELLEKNVLSHNAVMARTITVSRAMTPAPIIIEPDAPAHEAARLMLEHFIGCLPVMRGETLVGIVTNSDLLIAFMVLSQRPLPLSGFIHPI